jgi:branched-chain amino acid transport system substrate-binding protein
MRKALVLLLVLAFVAAACGGDGDDDVATDTGTGTETTESDEGEAREVTTGPGVDDDEIRVAVLNDFSGPIASIGTPAAVGSEIYFDALNEQGGVCGRDVVVVREDTKYDTQVAVQAYRAVKDDVAFITQLLGTATVLALANDVGRENITTLAGTLAAAVIPLEDIWVYQTPFPLEAVNGVSWAAEEHAGDDGTLQLGVIYQNDAYGQEGLSAVQHTAEELGNVEIVASAGYSPTDQDFTAQVQEMERGGAEVVWLHDTPRQTAAVLGIAAQRGYSPLFIGNSSSFASALAEPLGELLNRFRVVNSNASWGEDVPAMDEMLAAVEQHAPNQQPDNWLVTGWISGMVTHAALEAACENGDLSREGIASVMPGLEVDMKGMAPDISWGSTPEEQIPARAARVNEIDLESTFPRPVTDYFTSDAAESWTLPES